MELSTGTCLKSLAGLDLVNPFFLETGEISLMTSPSKAFLLAFQGLFARGMSSKSSSELPSRRMGPSMTSEACSPIMTASSDEAEGMAPSDDEEEAISLEDAGTRLWTLS